MPLTFPFPVKADISDEMSLPSIILTYGDGYKQRRQDGLNLPKEIWNIECPLAKKADELVLQAFLVDVGNHKPFLWQSPRDTSPQYYYIVGKIGGRYRQGGGMSPDFFVRTMQFECANIAIVNTIILPPTPVISVAAVGSTGWNIGTSTTTGVIVNYRITVVGPATTSADYTVTIPSGGGSVFISPVGTGNRTETLEILVGTSYTIGSPASASLTIATGLVYVFDQDTNGLIHWLGTNLGTTTFSNPIGTSRLSVLASSTLNSSPDLLTARIAHDWYSDNLPNQWVAWDLQPGHQMAITRYTIVSRDISPPIGDLPQNWALEGTNSVGSFTIGGINAATWTTIDQRINDGTLNLRTQPYTPAAPITGSAAAYRYLRIRQSGLNSYGRDYFTLSGIEFYGVYT